MKAFHLAQRTQLAWLRTSGPLQRFLVILRYQGPAPAWRAALDRLRGQPASVAPPEPGSAAAPRVASLPTGSGTAPAVSVVLRTHNRPALLRHALSDLANQTFADFEVVLVNDGEVPVDVLVDEFREKLQLSLASHRAGTGRVAALNSGIRQSTGHCLTYLDDDDRLYPNHLATLFGGFGPGVDVVYTRAAQVLCWSDLTTDRIVARQDCVSRAFDYKTLLIDNWIPFTTVMHRRDCITETGEFDESLELLEDWDFLIRLGRECRFEHIPELTCEYRFRFGEIPDRARSASTARERILAATRRIYDRYPVADGESRARRRLTLNALRRDIAEVAWIEATVGDPALRDLRTVAWAGRFPHIAQYERALKRELSAS